MKKLAFLFMLLLGILGADAQSRPIKGKITDKATGLGLPDVSVLERGTTNGTRTGADGTFSLNTSNPGKVDLEISTVSYGTQLITTDGSSDVSVIMDKQNKSLDEVV